jgi:hypothetical protein
MNIGINLNKIKVWVVCIGCGKLEWREYEKNYLCSDCLKQYVEV